MGISSSALHPHQARHPVPSTSPPPPPPPPQARCPVAPSQARGSVPSTAPPSKGSSALHCTPKQGVLLYVQVAKEGMSPFYGRVSCMMVGSWLASFAATSPSSLDQPRCLNRRTLPAVVDPTQIIANKWVWLSSSSGLIDFGGCSNSAGNENLWVNFAVDIYCKIFSPV